MEGLGTLGRLGFEGLLLFVYPNLLSSGLIYRLEGGGELGELRYIELSWVYLLSKDSESSNNV